jgi:hypothetical protein
MGEFWELQCNHDIIGSSWEKLEKAPIFAVKFMGNLRNLSQGLKSPILIPIWAFSKLKLVNYRFAEHPW